MKLTAEAALSAPRERVFSALVDPEVLQRCIPGCEELAAVGDDVYRARLKIGLAGLNGTYEGTVSLRERVPPRSFTLTVEGKGAPGFARGTAVIRLEEAGTNTAVVCEADVRVGGVIAAVGSRLVEAAARKLANDFFRRLAAEIDRPTRS
jgi:carbon monoxide dehydrogenase subunit G